MIFVPQRIRRTRSEESAELRSKTVAAHVAALTAKLFEMLKMDDEKTAMSARSKPSNPIIA
jgi:hypothetical protein